MRTRREPTSAPRWGVLGAPLWGVLGASLLLGCGGEPPTSRTDGSVVHVDAGPGGDRDGGTTDAGSSGGADSGSSVDGGSSSGYPFCRVGCARAEDCAVSGAPLYDASHHVCEAGVCRWTGCQSDAECRATFARDDYACRAVSGLMQCVDTCATAADCGSGTAAFDADNYACRGGICEYTGCRDDAECEATFASDRYACRRATLPDTGLPIPSATMNCVLRCTTGSECTTGSPAFDADNYTCSTEGACVYAGCNDDAECRSTFSSSAYVCR